MPLFIFLAIIGVTVVTTLMAPFLWGNHQDALEVASSAPVDLLARKDAALAALKDLEFDYRTRKLSLEDYEELRAIYRVEAAEVLKAMDQGAAPPADLDALIDAEVAAWRTRRARREEETAHETA
jgi:hypothetical protein